MATKRDPMAPKRGRPLEQPNPDQVRAARDEAGLTQSQAGELVYAKLRTWQGWEQGESSMPLGLWELFLIKIGRRQP